MPSLVRSKMPLQLLNVLGFIGTLVLNALANALPINGKNTGELSDQYPNLFTPAGLTFSIWGLIYLLLAVFCVYQGKDLFSNRKEDLPFVQRIGPLFLVSCLANMSWILAWHYEHVTLSLLIMLVIFSSLLGIYLRLDIGKAPVRGQEKYLVHLPFSVYLGWITVAMIANVTAWLVNTGWYGGSFPEETWAIIMVITATLITVFVLSKRRDVAYSLVIIWALAGIVIKRFPSDVPTASSLIVTAYACMLIIAIGAAMMGLRKMRREVKSTV